MVAAGMFHFGKGVRHLSLILGCSVMSTRI